jgi:hypothetical protein
MKFLSTAIKFGAQFAGYSEARNPTAFSDEKSLVHLSLFGTPLTNSLVFTNVED